MDAAAMLQRHEAVLDRVFHDRLDGQGGQHKIAGVNIKGKGHIRKPDLFDAQIVLHMLHFLGHTDRSGIVQLSKISPQIFGKAVDQFSGLGRIFFAKVLDATQGVIYEVGADLAHHGRDAAFRQLGVQGIFLRLQLFCLDGGIDILRNDSEHHNHRYNKQKHETVS